MGPLLKTALAIIQYSKEKEKKGNDKNGGSGILRRSLRPNAMRHDCFFSPSLFELQTSHVVARIEEIEKKSQWIKDSGKELDLDLYGELT